jgi:hypothetical protein
MTLWLAPMVRNGGAAAQPYDSITAANPSYGALDANGQRDIWNKTGTVIKINTLTALLNRQLLMPQLPVPTSYSNTTATAPSSRAAPATSALKASRSRGRPMLPPT